MSYQEREHPLGERKDDELHTIYVNNLPDELNEAGITQIFQSYGKICGLFTPTEANWAYVSYETYKEAEHAVRSLNERSPLYLKVAFRKKKVQPKTQKYSSPLVNGAPIEQTDCGYPQNGISHNIDVRRSTPRAQVFTLPQMPSCNPALDTISVYPTEVDHNVYNPFESTGRYTDTNAMWSRGCVNIDNYGKRYVSMGRGYTRYHIPEPAYAQIEQHIGRVYEKRRAGFYQYGDDKLQHEIGKCLYCGHSAKLRCAKCNAFYCSRECQVGDWPHHRTECKIIPPLVGEFDAAAHSSAEEPIHVTRKPRGIVELGPLSSLRRPKRVTNMAKIINSEDLETPKQEIPIDQMSPQIKSPRHEEYDGNAVAVEKDVAPSVKCSQPQGSSTERGKTVESAKRESDRRNKNERNDVNDRVKDNSGADPFKPDSKNLQQNFSSIRNNDRPLSVKSSTSMVETAKTDYLKLEEDMAFESDPRVYTNVANQAPVDPELAVKIEPAVQQEIVTSVESTKIESAVISRDSFTDVCVVIVLPDQTLWVNKKEDVRKLEVMMTELNEKVENYEKVTELVVGETYAVQYETIWHRASILTTNPIRIMYIDFGNDEPPQSQDFRSLRDFTAYPALAIRVRLSENSKTIEPEQELSVKMIGVDENGIVEVVVPDAVKKTVSPKAQSGVSEVTKEETLKITEIPKLTETKLDDKSSRNLPNTIDSLNVDSEGFVQAYMALDKNSYAVCVLSSDFMEEYQLIFEAMTEFCKAANTPTNFSPKVGDFVCGKRDDIWVRGYVFSLGPPIRLALVDEARVAPVERVIPMPSEYEKICSFGSICTFKIAHSKLDVNETGQFRVTEIVNEAGVRIVKGALLSPDNLKNARFTLKNWTPTPEQKGIRYAELRSNTEVCISAYSSERIMYVRSLDNASLESSQRIIQNVAKWAQKAPKLDETPVIGQLVIAKFVDGNYYRAVVTKLLDGKIGVSYVDYGNSELTTIDQLRLLSDELKEQTSCASKIILKDVKVDVPPTKEVHQYLDLLVGTEQPLVCTFEGIPSKDGVTLTTVTGECVNEKVNTYLIPVWQREDPSKNLKCFMVDNLETATLGEIGYIVKALPLFATDPPFKYVMAPFDKEHLTHITGIMPGLVRKYCESTKEHYIPRTNELCLAVWEGGWYRGACMNRNETPTQALIYFVDFGNMAIVDHTDIRQMTKDFMSPGGLGLSCIVKNLGIQLVNGKVPENIQRRVEELVPINDLIDVKIIKKSTPENNIEGDYEVELPTVKEKLVAEGLAKP